MELQSVKNESIILRKVKILLAQREKQFKELAENVGMTQQGLRYSLKRNKTSFEVVKKIAVFLGVSAHYLADDAVIDAKPVYRNTEKVMEAYQRLNEPEKAVPSDMQDALKWIADRHAGLEKIVRYFVREYPNDPMSVILEGKIALIGANTHVDSSLMMEINRILSE
jgi:transcriptional regulator with XRE-family HTH domain